MNKTQKKHVYISIFAFLLFGFLFFQEPKIKDAAEAMRLGNYYFNGAGGYDLEKSEGAFKKAVAIDNEILWGHYQLARVYFVKGEKDKALEEINKELEANPENLRSLYVRGLIYGAMGRLQEAESDFKNFTMWAPKEWAGYNDLAWILAKEGKYAEAEKAAQKGIKEALDGNKNPWLWNSLGVAQLNLKKYSEAKKSFEAVKKLAQNLTLQEWQRAYPGNNPEESARGLDAFKIAVQANFNTAVDRDGI